MSLFIPRKQDILGSAQHAISASTGAPSNSEPWFNHAEEALRQNFLAIQNWANRRATSCSVRNSSTTGDTILNGTVTQLSFDSVSWDYSTIASTSAQTITIPEAGIYLVSAGVSVNNIPGQTHMSLFMNPGGYPVQDGFLTGSTAGTYNMSWGGNIQKFNSTQVGTTLTVNFDALMPSTADVCNALLKEFSLTKFADIPSKVQ